MNSCGRETVLRIDIFLKNTGLFRSRSQAKQACDDGAVSVGGICAKASADVDIGDVIVIDSDERFFEAEVLLVPPRPIARNRRADCFRTVREERRSRGEILSFDNPVGVAKPSGGGA